MRYTIRQLEGLFPDYRVISHAVDSSARMTVYLGRFAYNKYLTRLSCAVVSLVASNWKRVRILVAVHK